MRQHRIALVIGTRPEAIKLGPVARALAGLGEPPLLYVTGQHPGLELRDHQLDTFATVGLQCPGQPDPTLHADLVRSALRRQIPFAPPDLVIVIGGSSGALGGALAAREAGIPLAHVEAGLRTFDPNMPWPEEENRATIDRLADLLFAPTSLNAANLRREQVCGSVKVTGSTGIDALVELTGPLPLRPRWRPPWKPFSLLVTCHRRENWGAPLQQLADAARQLADSFRITLLLPPNPTITDQMTRLMSGLSSVTLVPPLSHAAVIEELRRADLLLTDSFGLQEEALALRVPFLLLRETTERSEALPAGKRQLVGMQTQRIVEAVQQLHRQPSLLREMRQSSCAFGDGAAASRIARYCQMFLEEVSELSVARMA